MAARRKRPHTLLWCKDDEASGHFRSTAVHVLERNTMVSTARTEPSGMASRSGTPAKPRRSFPTNAHASHPSHAHHGHGGEYDMTPSCGIFFSTLSGIWARPLLVLV